MKDLLDGFLDLLPLISIGVAGSILQSLKRWTGWRNFMYSILTSGFGALLIGELSQGMGWNSGIAFFVAGMIGYSGGSLVDAALARTRAKIENGESLGGDLNV